MYLDVVVTENIDQEVKYIRGTIILAKTKRYKNQNNSEILKLS